MPKARASFCHKMKAKSKRKVRNENKYRSEVKKREDKEVPAETCAPPYWVSAFL
jgi:hypothetical protein